MAMKDYFENENTSRIVDALYSSSKMIFGVLVAIALILSFFLYGYINQLDVERELVSTNKSIAKELRMLREDIGLIKRIEVVPESQIPSETILHKLDDIIRNQRVALNYYSKKERFDVQ